MPETMPNPEPGPDQIIDAIKDAAPITGVTDLGDGSYDVAVTHILEEADLPPNGAGQK